MTTPTQPGLSSLALSLIRTVVALAVGAAITWLVGRGVDLRAAAPGLTELLTAVVSAAYYAVVRVLEHYVSAKFGWLLGAPTAPVYPVKG